MTPSLLDAPKFGVDSNIEGAVGAHHPDTSVKAASGIRRVTGKQRRRLYDAVVEYGPMTREQMSAATGLRDRSLLGRCVELLDAGFFVVVGETENDKRRPVELIRAVPEAEAVPVDRKRPARIMREALVAILEERRAAGHNPMLAPGAIQNIGVLAETALRMARE